MSRFALVFAIVAVGACGSSAPAAQQPVVGAEAPPPPMTNPPGGDVTLTYRTPAVGSTIHQEKTESADVVYGGTPLTVETTSFEHVDVMAADAFPTKLRVHYERDHEVQTVMGQTTTVPSPMENNTYVVWTDGGAFEASRIHAVDGAVAVTAEELEELTKRFDDELGRRPGIVEMFLRHPWRLDEAVELGGQDLIDLTEEMGNGGTVDAATVTLRDVDGTTAAFALTVDVTLGGETEGRVAASVEVTLDTAHLRPLRMGGQLQIDAKAQGTPFSATSTMTTVYTYE